MKRYLLFWISLTAALVLVAAAFSFVVDPYRLFGWVDSPGFNHVKPAAGSHGAMAKAYQVLRIHPRGLILGNSRSEVGFDPEDPDWPAAARPVFNLALPGTGTGTSVAYLQHVLADDARRGAPAPAVVVWGIDFMDFLVDPDLPRERAGGQAKGNRLLVNGDGSPNAMRWLQQARDMADATLSIDAFIDSVKTLDSQHNPYAQNMTPLGFNPMNDYRKITAQEGYWSVFRQRDEENTRAYLRRPAGIFNAGERSSPDLDNLRKILHLCRQHGIDLKLVIYPYHAHLLEIIRITGHWSAFEAWKREVVRILAEDEAASKDKATVSLWDFSGFNVLTTEAVPQKGDRQAKMQWYWEAGHFKHELGGLMLDRIFAAAKPIPGFGVLLTPANIDAEIARTQAQEAVYRQTHPQDVAELERIAAKISAGTE